MIVFSKIWSFQLDIENLIIYRTYEQKKNHVTFHGFVCALSSSLRVKGFRLSIYSLRNVSRLKQICFRRRVVIII